MVLNISVLFREGNRNDFVVLLSNKGMKAGHDIFLEEFRSRGFKRCSKCTSPGIKGVALVDIATGSKTVQQPIDASEVTNKEYYQTLLFKTTWKSKTLGLELENSRTFAREVHWIFNPNQEVEEDMELGTERKTSVHPSSSGVETRSTTSSLLDSERWGPATSSGAQSMEPDEELFTTEDIVSEVKRSAVLRLGLGLEESSAEPRYNSIRRWLNSFKSRTTTLPDILSTEDLDRKLGNIVETEVGTEGAEVFLRSYKIDIPPNSVKIKTNFKFRVSLEMDIPEYPQDLIPISLPLYCSPGDLDFDEKISMAIPTWVRKADLSPNSPPIPIFVYTKRKDNDWECVESSELTSTGIVEFQCDHFCVNAAFMKRSDAERVLFKIEHILFRDDEGCYTSCHFLASDPFVNAMLQDLRQNYKFIHSPTYASLAKHGDEISVSLECTNSEIHRFATSGGCVLKICEDFYLMNRRESFTFLLTPKPHPDTSIEFVYTIGEKRFLHRDQLKEKAGDTGNIIVQRGGVANVHQERARVFVQKRSKEVEEGPSMPKMRRLSCDEETESQSKSQTDRREQYPEVAADVESDPETEEEASGEDIHTNQTVRD